MEIWKTVEGFSKYEVSNLGRIRGGRNPEYIHKGSIDKDGYILVLLQSDIKGKYARDRLTSRLHRLIAKTFLPNPDNKPEVNHKDGNKQNNCVSNLEWVTTKENIQHSFKIGLKDNQILMNSKPVAKICPTTGEVLKIYPSGKATKEDGYFPNSVRGCCRGDYGRVLHKGYKWKFVEKE